MNNVFIFCKSLHIFGLALNSGDTENPSYYFFHATNRPHQNDGNAFTKISPKKLTRVFILFVLHSSLHMQHNEPIISHSIHTPEWTLQFVCTAIKLHKIILYFYRNGEWRIAHEHSFENHTEYCEHSEQVVSLNGIQGTLQRTWVDVRSFFFNMERISVRVGIRVRWCVAAFIRVEVSNVLFRPRLNVWMIHSVRATHTLKLRLLRHSNRATIIKTINVATRNTIFTFDSPYRSQFTRMHVRNV